MAIHVHDNLRRRKLEFTPLSKDYVGMYVCGMTVQDKPHIGHMYSSIAGDTIRRYLEYKGYNVKYIYNFTDVDDKIIQKSNEENIPWQDIAQRNIEVYFKYAGLLGIRPATVYPKASEHMPDIIELIRRIEEKDCAYASGGDVYFAVEKWPGYGKLSGRKLDELRAGARVEPGEKKRNPLDFALWKAAKEGEPSWESPWGNGRPGWHIECSAMSMKYLGESFDLHGGGQDLIFPHHENEIAQSEAATGKPFVNFWVENGLMNLTGEKMSKSTKHFFSVEDVCAEVRPDTLKFYLLSTHYRSPVEFSRERLVEAEAALERLRNVIRNAAIVSKEIDSTLGSAEGGLSEVTRETEKRFVEAMDDDFNSARAVGHLFDLAKTINKEIEAGMMSVVQRAAIRCASEKLKELAQVLGVFWDEGLVAEEFPKEVKDLVQEREAARKGKEWGRADEIRAKIEALGFSVEDRLEGSILRKRSS